MIPLHAAAPLNLPRIDYAGIAPVLIVLAAACLGVLFEAFLPRAQRWLVQVTLTMVALAVAAIALGAYLWHHPGSDVTTFAGSLALDRPALFLWGTLLGLGCGAVLLIADRTVEPGGAFVAEAGIRPPEESGRAPAGRARMRTEVFPFALFSLAGMMVFCAANDLLSMFVALEVLSLPLYLMCGLARRRRLLSQEAAMKYFLLGAFASAFFLYGVAMLYGYANSVRLPAIAAAVGGSHRSQALLFLGMGLLLIGLLFKGSVAPFHGWTPDVYQGAPTPLTAFMGACTKVAAFGAILRVLMVGFGSTRQDWNVVLWIVAAVSMFAGAILGITQRDVKRMIAYSSVAHAGFLLIGVLALDGAGLAATLFYLVAYGFTTLAAFGVVSLVRDGHGEATGLSAWAGLAKRSPVLAGVFTFLLLALAGIPLTSGFVGKFVVFSAGFSAGIAPLVVLGLIASTVAAFVYLRVIVLMYFSAPAADGPTVTVPGMGTTAAITLGTLVTLLLGVFPSFLLDWAAGGGFAM